MWDILGKVVVAYLLARFLSYVWHFCRCFVFPRMGWKKNLKNFGEWAVVTGSTDGIGKEYAKQLARKGLKLILISRSQDKLDAVASEIASELEIDIKTIAFDYGATSGYENIEKEISGLEIGILVNNVGMGYEYPEFFADCDIDNFQKMLNVNMLSAIKMTHMILPQMVKRNKGIIIHISSASAIAPMPLISVYSATKAFVDFFARALQIEYRSKGIISQVVLPFFVETKMSQMKKTPIIIPTPQDYVPQALCTVGIANRIFGYWSHDIQNVLVQYFSAFPPWLRDPLAMKMILDAQKRLPGYLAKKLN